MNQKSFIYRNIKIYRLIMNLLYAGRYRKRFTDVAKIVNSMPQGSTVVELCFGDIYLAEHCKKVGMQWKGYDLNSSFVAHARSLGYDATITDLIGVSSLPTASVCVMMGSLYHFHKDLRSLFSKIFACTDHVIISEPVKNYSSMKGIAGFFAKRFANAGNGAEQFRFTKTSLLLTLQNYSKEFSYIIKIHADQGKDMIIKLEKNGSN